MNEIDWENNINLPYKESYWKVKYTIALGIYKNRFSK